MRTEEELKSILNSHTVFTLREEIAKTNIFGYAGMKKAELIKIMLEKAERFQHMTMYVRPKRKKGVRNPRPTRFITETPDLKLGQRKNTSLASMTNDYLREEREKKSKEGAKSVRKRELVRNYEEIKEKVKDETKDVVAKPVRKYKKREKKGEGSRGKYAKTAEEKAKKVKDKLKAVEEQLKALEEKKE